VLSSNSPQNEPQILRIELGFDPGSSASAACLSDFLQGVVWIYAMITQIGENVSRIRCVISKIDEILDGIQPALCEFSQILTDICEGSVLIW